jgi:hypothetical protein
MTDPDLATIQHWVEQLDEAWSAVWSEQGTPEDVAYVGFVIDQLAEHFGLHDEGKSDENADESPDDEARFDAAPDGPAHGREENGESQEG